jgi:hypothetical protein
VLVEVLVSALAVMLEQLLEHTLVLVLAHELVVMLVKEMEHTLGVA